MCYSLNSSHGCYIGNIQVSIIGVLKEDTRLTCAFMIVCAEGRRLCGLNKSG